MIRKLMGIALVALLTVGLTVPSEAALFDLIANLDGAQANMGNGTGSPGTGLAEVTYDDESNELGWNVSWSGVTGDPTAMHFHGPAMPGENASVAVGIGVGSNPAIGTATIDDTQETELLDGLWYVNLHTTDETGGEIRGQVNVIPEPTTVAMLLLGIGTAVGLTRRRRRQS